MISSSAIAMAIRNRQEILRDIECYAHLGVAFILGRIFLFVYFKLLPAFAFLS